MSGLNAGTWPMSNEELREWFSKEDIPIQHLAEMWLRMDQDETTKAEITQLLNEAKTIELEKRLRHRIQFGTAGNTKLNPVLTQRSPR
jgi:hypothetical protein